MKKRRITYGVTGMMEYQAVIKIGRSQMKVLFTDGSATGYGMNPANYTTDNMMVQQAIENSEQFRRGLIHIVGSAELEEEVEVISRCGERDLSDGSDKSDKSDKSEEKENPGITEIEFDNNDDAKDYLEQTYGCVRSKLRNRSDITAAGAQYGVKIIFS